MDRRKIDMSFDGRRLTRGEIETYKKHLKAINEPISKIDNSPPPLLVTSYFDQGNLQSDAVRLSRVEQENRKILNLINVIYRTKGKVDTKMDKEIKSTNFYDRMTKNKEIEKKNKLIYELILSAESRYKKKDMERDYARALKSMIFNAVHPEYYTQYLTELEKWDICPFNKIDRGLCDTKKRVRCYFDIAMEEKDSSRIKLGRMIFEIYRDYVPRTADHFLSFVRGYRGRSYKGSQFFIIQKWMGCVGGDVKCKNGSGYYAKGGKCFPDESHVLRFNGPGVISTFTLFPNHNHSHFFISFKQLNPLDKRLVVFGRVIQSLTVLERVEECGTASGSPKRTVVVENCGIFGKYPFQQSTDEGAPMCSCCSKPAKTSENESSTTVREGQESKSTMTLGGGDVKAKKISGKQTVDPGAKEGSNDSN